MKTREGFKATYLGLSEDAFAHKISAAEKIMSDCTLCPRECRVERTAGETGFCRTDDNPFVSSWGPHFGEERPLVGQYGSGTIFLGNCNPGCIFCQNYSISFLGEGREISHEQLAAIMLDIQGCGCHNINFVTPTHQVPAILKALKTAAGKGLNIPLVYNSGGYESIGALNHLDGVIDIYMPDFKYADGSVSGEYSDARDYPETAKAALKEMHAQVGDLRLDERGSAVGGLLVRHLVLPDNKAGTSVIVRFIADEIAIDTHLNIMDQYHPCYGAFGKPPLDRRITDSEYPAALKQAESAGLRRIDGVTI